MPEQTRPEMRIVLLSALFGVGAALVAATAPLLARMDWIDLNYLSMTLYAVFGVAVLLVVIAGLRPQMFGEWRRHVMGLALLTVVLIATTWGVQRLLGRVDVLGLGPADAGAVVAAATGLPALIAAAITVGPQFIKAWGMRAKDTGEGRGAAAEGDAARIRAEMEGEAARIRAEKEGEAARIRAEAELLRAKAEMKRAQMGLDPLPAPQILPPDQPLALPPGSTNGNAPDPAP